MAQQRSIHQKIENQEGFSEGYLTYSAHDKPSWFDVCIMMDV